MDQQILTGGCVVLSDLECTLGSLGVRRYSHLDLSVRLLGGGRPWSEEDNNHLRRLVAMKRMKWQR